MTPPEDRVPATVVPRGGDAQSALVGTAVTVPPSAVVLDASGEPVPGVTVVFAVTGGGGSITGAVAETDAEGEAHVGSWTLGEQPGVNELTAVVEGLPPAVMQATGRVGAPRAIVVVTPPPESALAGGDVAPLPVVQVVDGFGNPVPDVTVLFEVLEGGGSVAPDRVDTDVQGRASPARWTLGARAGPNVLQVTVDDVEAVRLTVEGVGGAPARATAVQGDDQQGSAGETLPLAPAVRIEDAMGNPVPGVAVTFTVVSGGGAVTPSVVTTDADGVAEAGSWTLGDAGESVVEATADGIDPVRFNANVVAGGARDLRLVAGDDQVAAVGSRVPVDPTVRLVDGNDDPIAGYPIDFGVREGGGSVSPARVVTDADGRASAAWTLGPTPGFQSLEARADGFDQIVFTADATAGAPARLVVVAGDRQGAVTGGEVPVAPAVRVLDAFGNPVGGATVTFAVVEGGGTVTGARAVTDADGVAAVGSWTLGPTPGTNRLRATSGDATPATFTATAVVGGSYELDIRLVGDATPVQRQALEAARARWSEVVQGDLPPVPMSVAAGACVEGQPALQETIDDLVIFVRFEPIDGPGQVLGSAGPCYIRSESRLPVVGIINLDSDDLDRMADQGILETVILHEMGHVLGLGTLWSTLDLLVGEGGPDPFFVGPAAREAWAEIGGPAVYAGTPVPVENTGGAGTRDGHWRESVLRNELMTGFVDLPPNPMSRLTVASLADAGYVVDLAAADAFVVPASSPPAAPARLGELEELPLPPPVRVDASGTPVGGRR